MRPAKEVGQSSRETALLCSLLSLLILEIFSPLAAANGYILFPTGFRQQSKQEAPVSPQPTDSKEKVTFQLSLISDGFLCPIDDLKCPDRDIRWKDFALTASDGHALHLTSIPFPNVERSKKHFQASIKGADKILRRDSESDSKGEPIGERALGLFPAVKDVKSRWGVPYYRGVPCYKLFWTWDKNYLELQGEHLEDVLALESRLKEEGINAVWTWHKPYVR